MFLQRREERSRAQIAGAAGVGAADQENIFAFVKRRLGLCAGGDADNQTDNRSAVQVCIMGLAISR